MILKEKLCIQLALNAKAESAQRKLTMLKLKIPDPEYNIPEFLRKKGKYEPTPKETKKSVLELFVTCLFSPIIAVFLVIKHCGSFWRSLQYKHHLKKIIKDSTSKQNNYVLPARKSLLALWRIHGFPGYGDKDEVKLDVLDGWIRILYGDELAEDIDLSCRLKTIRMQQAKNFYKCVENDVHCRFMAPFEELVYKLSEELPEYC